MIRSGLNLIQQALTIYDRDLRLAVCNSRFSEMFNLPPDLTTPGAEFEKTARFLAQNGEYGDVDNIDAFVREKVDQALAFAPHYMERRRANGRTISVEGHPLGQGGWVTVYTDITDIKTQESMLRSHSAQLSDQLLTRAEELGQTNRALEASILALEETKRQLTDSEALARMTTEMMPAHIAHLDLRERYSYSNRRLPDVIPGTKPNIVGLGARAALGDAAYDAIHPYLTQAYLGQPSVFEFTHADSARRIRGAFTPHFDSDDRVDGVYVLSMDVTEEAQARAALAQSHKRQLAAQLTSGLAHDFSNLLTIILGLQGRLEKLGDLRPDALDLIGTTRAAALRGGVLLDRLSNISARREINLGNTDLSRLLGDVRALATPSLPDAITLDCRLVGIEHPVVIDAGFLQDSLLNLILNARDALGNTDGNITIVARSAGKRWLEITVVDTGPGFSERSIGHALDPFYTTKHVDDGSGLGLSMVYDFAQLSGGHLKIANDTGGGARVTVRLPLKYGQQNADPRLVLLVEDSVEVRTEVREMLRDLGHSVVEASSADEAENLATIPGVDIVLSDIILKGPRSGLDLGRALAATKAPARVYLMTSLPKTDTTRGSASKEFPLIGKPFSTAQLAGFLN